MATYLIDITIEVEAKSASKAWDKANELISDLDCVVEVSEPERAD